MVQASGSDWRVVLMREAVPLIQLLLVRMVPMKSVAVISTTLFMVTAVTT